MEKLDNGQKVFRSMKMEEKRVKEFEEINNKKIGRIYEQIEKECEDILKKKGNIVMCDYIIGYMDSIQVTQLHVCTLYMITCTCTCNQNETSNQLC